MRKTPTVIAFGLVVLLVVSFITGQMSQNRKLPTVKRAKRPEFKKRDWDQVFFENIFKDGFVGDRPGNLSESAQPKVASKTDTKGNTGGSGSTGSEKWSAIIDRTVLEDEIKKLQIRLETEVTTPTKYASDHHKARLTFATLSMLFAIIEKYDGDVRWKKDAPYARAAFVRAAANARTGSQQAYNNAKKQKENLKELVRGSSFPQDSKPSSEWDWVDVIDRGPIMQKLEILYSEHLKPDTNSQATFRSKSEEVLHYASLVAAVSEVMGKPSSEDADDEDYMVYVKSMKDGAMQIVSGTKTNAYPLVEKGINAIGQSCTNCHEDYR